jgi:hypothetical protein
MHEPGRDPRRLLRWKQVMTGARLHLHRPLECILDLMEIVRVPVGHQLVALEGEGTGAHGIAGAHVHHANAVRFGQIIGHMCRDGHRGPSVHMRCQHDTGHATRVARAWGRDKRHATRVKGQPT